MTTSAMETLENCADQSYCFFVSGNPKTQGSKRAFGRAYTDKTGRQRVAVTMVEQATGLHPWRDLIGRIATLLRPSDWKQSGLFVLTAVFYMPRPKYHFNSKGQLKPSAPTFHAHKGDADKLLRACGDALTKICYEDDGMVIATSSVKLFCDPADGPGVFIRISRLSEEKAALAVRDHWNDD